MGFIHIPHGEMAAQTQRQHRRIQYPHDPACGAEFMLQKLS